MLSTALLKPRRKGIRFSMSIVDSVALALLAAAYFILYFIFTPQLKPEDYAWLAYLMLAAYLVAFIYVIVMGLVKRE